MSRSIRFCTLYPPCSNIELLKDVGQIPYTLNKLYGCNCSVAGYNIRMNEMNNNSLKGLSINSIKKIINKDLTGLIYILKNARKIDWLNLYHGGRSVYFWSKLYHFLNPKGKIYLKLDMDFRLCDKFDDDKNERKIFKKVLENVDLVSAESLAIRNRVQKYTNKNIEIISNGFQKIGGPINVAQDREDCFLTVGRLGTEQKATEILIESFVKSSKYHNWKLRLVGNYDNEFKRYFDNLLKTIPELKERIILMGEINNREELYNLYCKSKVFVLPSKWESFGLVVSEALSCGCRVIVSNQVPPMKEFTNDGKYGQVVNAGDVESLFGAFIKEAEHTHNKKESYEISEYANKNFSWDQICKKLYSCMLNDEDVKTN